MTLGPAHGDPAPSSRRELRAPRSCCSRCSSLPLRSPVRAASSAARAPRAARVRRARAAAVGRAAPAGLAPPPAVLASRARARRCSSSRPRKPQRTVAVPVERAAIMLATDVSGSMHGDRRQARPPDRRQARRARASSTTCPSGVHVGVVAFNNRARVLQSADAPTAPTCEPRSTALAPSGGTATGEAIARALRRRSRRRPSADGKTRRRRRSCCSPTAPRPTAATRSRPRRRPRRRKIPVYTVALGTADGTITVPGTAAATETERVPPDPEALRADRAGLRRRDLHRRRRRRAQRRLRAARLAARPPATRAPGHRRASPAAALRPAARSAPRMSLRWFGRLDLTPRNPPTRSRPTHLRPRRRTERPRRRAATSRATRSRRRCTRSSASSSARTRCSSACSSRCSPAATCCSRACPASPRR